MASCSHGTSSPVLPARNGTQVTQRSYGYRTIFRFSASRGVAPSAGLIAIKGEFYSTTPSGGKYDEGTVFKISPSGREKVIYSFKGGSSDGVTPLYGTLIVVKGELYGTTEYGGAHGDGTVFRVTRSGKERVVYSFKGGKDGTRPWGGVVAVKGVLYGTTYSGGSNNLGTVFKLARSGHEKIIHTFTGGSDGAYPMAALTAVNGELFGTTEQGGNSNVGTVFEISTTGGERVIHSFAGAPANDGANPTSPLTNVGGTLYGTTQNAGNSASMTPWGTVYAISTSGSETLVHTFANGPDGADPLYGSLTYVGGVLYGTTSDGGSAGLGTIFKLTTSGTETVMYDFAGGSDGALPYPGPIEFGNQLYGVTFEGGNAQSNGTAYTISP